MKNQKHTSLVANTARGITLKGNKTPLKTNKAKKGSAKKQTSIKRKKYRKNGAASSGYGGILGMILGAFVINLGDATINKFFPNLGDVLRIGGKAGLGFLVKNFGTKVSFLRSIAPFVGNSLYFAAALDGTQTYAMPMVLPYVGMVQTAAQNALAPLTQQAVAQQTVTDTTTGQLGQAYLMPNGDVVEVYNNTRRPANQLGSGTRNQLGGVTSGGYRPMNYNSVFTYAR